MFTGSLSGNICGTQLPGTILASQTLNWRRPVFANQTIHAKVVINEIKRERKLITFDFEAKNDEGKTVVDGELMVKYGPLADEPILKS